jgi:hypothetical protein
MKTERVVINISVPASLEFAHRADNQVAQRVQRALNASVALDVLVKRIIAGASEKAASRRVGEWTAKVDGPSDGG